MCWCILPILVASLCSSVSFFPLLSTGKTRPGVLHPVLGSWYKRDTDVLGEVQQRATKMMKELEERLRALGLFSAFVSNKTDFLESSLDSELAPCYSPPRTGHSRTLCTISGCARGPPGPVACQSSLFLSPEVVTNL